MRPHQVESFSVILTCEAAATQWLIVVVSALTPPLPILAVLAPLVLVLRLLWIPSAVGS
jgi:hypothetical protein